MMYLYKLKNPLKLTIPHKNIIWIILYDKTHLECEDVLLIVAINVFIWGHILSW